MRSCLVRGKGADMADHESFGANMNIVNGGTVFEGFSKGSLPHVSF